MAPFVELTPEDRGQPPPPALSDVTHTNAVNRDYTVKNICRFHSILLLLLILYLEY